MGEIWVHISGGLYKGKHNPWTYL